jgi:hypothetical protein
VVEQVAHGGPAQRGIGAECLLDPADGVCSWCRRSAEEGQRIGTPKGSVQAPSGPERWQPIALHEPRDRRMVDARSEGEVPQRPVPGAQFSRQVVSERFGSPILARTTRRATARRRGAHADVGAFHGLLLR